MADETAAATEAGFSKRLPAGLLPVAGAVAATARPDWFPGWEARVAARALRTLGLPGTVPPFTDSTTFVAYHVAGGGAGPVVPGGGAEVLLAPILGVSGAFLLIARVGVGRALTAAGLGAALILFCAVLRWVAAATAAHWWGTDPASGWGRTVFGPAFTLVSTCGVLAVYVFALGWPGRCASLDS